MIKNSSPGMGMHKHGISGRSGKGPAIRHYLKREAEKKERKHTAEKVYSSVQEAFRSFKCL